MNQLLKDYGVGIVHDVGAKNMHSYGNISFERRKSLISIGVLGGTAREGLSRM